MRRRLRAATSPESPAPTTTTSTRSGSDPRVVAASAPVSDPAVVSAPRAPRPPAPARTVRRLTDEGAAGEESGVGGGVEVMGPILRQATTFVRRLT